MTKAEYKHLIQKYMDDFDTPYITAIYIYIYKQFEHDNNFQLCKH